MTDLVKRIHAVVSSLFHMLLMVVWPIDVSCRRLEENGCIHCI